MRARARRRGPQEKKGGGGSPEKRKTTRRKKKEKTTTTPPPQPPTTTTNRAGAADRPGLPVAVPGYSPDWRDLRPRMHALVRPEVWTRLHARYASHRRRRTVRRRPPCRSDGGIYHLPQYIGRYS